MLVGLGLLPSCEYNASAHFPLTCFKSKEDAKPKPPPPLDVSPALAMLDGDLKGVGCGSCVNAVWFPLQTPINKGRAFLWTCFLLHQWFAHRCNQRHSISPTPSPTFQKRTLRRCTLSAKHQSGPLVALFCARSMRAQQLCHRLKQTFANLSPCNCLRTLPIPMSGEIICFPKKGRAEA